MGSLTVALAEAAGEVVAVEVDRVLAEALQEVAGALPRVRIIVADAVTLDFDDLLGEGTYKMVSNLPYAIATPLVARLLQEAPGVEEMVFMVQQEVGERLVAPPGSKTYGAVSVLVAYHADAQIVGKVPRTVFWPKPKVSSAIVRLRRRPPPVDVDAGRLMEVVRAAFAQRRKTVRNSLASALGRRTDEVEEVLQRAGIDPALRAERLSLEEFARLAQAL
jgi:16S rRNA (adenine1518-N6/adenine1519-N6)-dimethyltransferase